MVLARLAHLFLLGLWGGLVLGEIVLELTATDEASRRHAARLHYWLDLCVELPLLVGVVSSGVVLAWLVWPLSWLHGVKLALAGVALGCNAVCVVLVIRRRQTQGDDLLRWARRVRWTGAGIPFGAAALGMGLWFFHR
ncbi:MAG: hypothetical protein HY904_01155 [Deltaproteobacteria bacterium]|nr:hypothetical protein [Deltaproteobacteria bacterium]